MNSSKRNNGKALKLHFITIISNIFIQQRLSRSLDLHSVIASFCFCQSLPIWERTQKPLQQYAIKGLIVFYISVMTTRVKEDAISICGNL